MIDIKNCSCLIVAGVDETDYPKFCDAYFESGEIDGRELTDDELEELTNENSDVVNELALEHIIGVAEFRKDCMEDR